MFILGLRKSTATSARITTRSSKIGACLGSDMQMLKMI